MQKRQNQLLDLTIEIKRSQNKGSTVVVPFVHRRYKVCASL